MSSVALRKGGYDSGGSGDGFDSRDGFVCTEQQVDVSDSFFRVIKNALQESVIQIPITPLIDMVTFLVWKIKRNVVFYRFICLHSIPSHRSNIYTPLNI